MSKLIFGFGFLLSLFRLFVQLVLSAKAMPLVVVFWVVILIGSGYRLFVAKPQKG
jgi:hypothetical protein